MKINLSKNSKKIITALLLIGLLLVLFFYIPLADIYAAVRAADLRFFIAAVLLGFPSVYFNTLSTWVLAGKQGIQIPLKEFFIFNVALRFYGYFSPASIISTAMRWQKLSANNKSAEALSAISFTRFFSIVIAVFMGLFWVMYNSSFGWLNLLIFMGLIFTVVAGWLTITRLSPRLALYLTNQAGKTAPVWIQKTYLFFGRYFDTIKIYSQMPYTVLLWVAFLDLCNEFLGLIAFIFLAQALKIPLSFSDLGWIRSISFLTALAPFTLPGGIGVREVSLVVILSAFNISPDVAAAYSFLIYSRGVVFSLLCGIAALGTIGQTS
jgi:uncharacterized protein (TIRG00374 family)